MTTPNQPSPRTPDARGAGAIDLEAFVQLKIADVQRAINAREQSQKTWLSGTDESWAKISTMHPLTRGKPTKKAERLEIAAKEGRILVKLRHELEMFNAVLEVVKSDKESPTQQ